MNHILERHRLHVELEFNSRDAYGWHDHPLKQCFYAVETLPKMGCNCIASSAAARKEWFKRTKDENHRQATFLSAAQALIPAFGKKGFKRIRCKASSDDGGLFTPQD